MATPVLIPVSEYLSTTYRPDVDYIDGELEERNFGEQPHAHVQGILYAIFRESQGMGVRPLPEQRLQISSSRYRIPDICIQTPSRKTKSVKDVQRQCVKNVMRLNS